MILRPKPVKAKRHLRFHKNFTKAQKTGASLWEHNIIAEKYLRKTARVEWLGLAA